MHLLTQYLWVETDWIPGINCLISALLNLRCREFTHSTTAEWHYSHTLLNPEKGSTACTPSPTWPTIITSTLTYPSGMTGRVPCLPTTTATCTTVRVPALYSAKHSTSKTTFCPLVNSDLVMLRWAMIRIHTNCWPPMRLRHLHKVCPHLQNPLIYPTQNSSLKSLHHSK